MPRVGLSRPVVVAEAARLADETGWSHLTVAALAKRFGVKLPSLYKHIDSLEGLRREVGALALRELGGELQAAAVGRSGSDALRAMASAYRAYARAHPGRYAATLAAPHLQTRNAKRSRNRSSRRYLPSWRVTAWEATTSFTRHVYFVPAFTALFHWKKAMASVCPTTSMPASTFSSRRSTRTSADGANGRGSPIRQYKVDTKQRPSTRP